MTTSESEFSAVPWYARKPDADPSTHDRDGLVFEVKRLRELLEGGPFECDGRVVSAYDVSKAAKALAEAYYGTLFHNYAWWNEDAEMFGGAPNEWRVRYETRPQWERLVREAFKMAHPATQSAPNERPTTQLEKDEQRGRVAYDAYRSASGLRLCDYDPNSYKTVWDPTYDACAAHATAPLRYKLEQVEADLREVNADRLAVICERNALAAKVQELEVERDTAIKHQRTAEAETNKLWTRVRELEAPTLPVDASTLGRIDFAAYNDAFGRLTGRDDSEPYDSDFHKNYMREAIDAGAVAVARAVGAAMLSDVAIGAAGRELKWRGTQVDKLKVEAALRAALAVALGPVAEVGTNSDADPCPVESERLELLGRLDDFGREEYSDADVAKVERWLARREMARAGGGGR